MRIIHLDTALALRGGQHQLLMLARGLRARGHEQLIVCPEGSGLEAHAHNEGFRVLRLPSYDPAHAHGILQVRQGLLLEPADVLHAHDGRGQTISWLASLGRRARLSRVASRRVTFSPGQASITRLKYGRACDGVIAVSESIKRLLLDAGVPARKVQVIPDGVELPESLPPAGQRARVRASWGFGEREFVAGHLGAFTSEKGQDVAVEALMLLAAELPRARLVLAGDFSRRTNPFEARIKQRVSHAGERVRLLSYVENLAEFFSGLDLYLMPSRAEGLGSSVLMAMARGLPVVASRVGGLPEIVEEGKTGWLVTPESPRALAEAVASAARDPARLERLGAGARESAHRFSSNLMVERTESFYADLRGRSPKDGSQDI
jgi:glycosyltransferase involved in cell wall biosynthesis